VYGRTRNRNDQHSIILPNIRLHSGAGDVIVAIDGRPVRNLFDLTSLLDERNVGDTVEVSRAAAAPRPWLLHSGVDGVLLLSASSMLRRWGVGQGCSCSIGSEAWQAV